MIDTKLYEGLFVKLELIDNRVHCTWTHTHPEGPHIYHIDMSKAHFKEFTRKLLLMTELEL